jgi:hypothetical protein
VKHSACKNKELIITSAIFFRYHSVTTKADKIDFPFVDNETGENEKWPSAVRENLHHYRHRVITHFAAIKSSGLKAARAN